MNALQAEFSFEIADPTVKNLVDMVLALLSDGRYWAPFELCDEIWRTRSIRVSDSSITARLRDCRKPEHGAHIVLIRKRQGAKFYEYKLEK